MRLDDLLAGVEIIDMGNLFPDMEVSAITADSRQVSPGSIFVAIAGDKDDGHGYIEQAVEAGASVVIQTRPLEPGRLGSFVRVGDSRLVYAVMCSVLAGEPSKQLRVIGVTGTNGKTSTVLITRHLLEYAGYRAAALGTLGLLMPGSSQFTQRGLTTPDAGNLQSTMKSLVDQGVTHLVLEVSSHALAQGRVAGIQFAGGVFTNLTQDHFDYHGSLEEYRAAKELLFSKHLVESGGYSVVNGDDPVGEQIKLRTTGVSVAYGRDPKHNLVLNNIETSPTGTRWSLVIKNGVWPAELAQGINLAEMFTTMVGRFNAYNCAAASGVALLEGLSLEQLQQGLASFKGVPGRLQKVNCAGNVTAFVDYAHTPDALANVLLALQEISGPDQRIITVFGCGGDRDKAKRPLMGGAAMARSDLLVVTSDNPRSEDPEAIIDDIMAGIECSAGEVYRESDRAKAIQMALGQAKSGDLVLVAGKGHEDYQVLADRTIHFADLEELEKVAADIGQV